MNVVCDCSRVILLLCFASFTSISRLIKILATSLLMRWIKVFGLEPKNFSKELALDSASTSGNALLFCLRAFSKRMTFFKTLKVGMAERL